MSCTRNVLIFFLYPRPDRYFGVKFSEKEWRLGRQRKTFQRLSMSDRLIPQVWISLEASPLLLPVSCALITSTPLIITSTIIWLTCWTLHYFRASLVAQLVKNLPAVQETWVQSLGWKDPLEKEMATHSSILAWKISWTEESCGLQFMGSRRVGRDWATNTYTILRWAFQLANGSFKC